MIRILFIGDIVGRSGRKVVKDLLPQIRKEYAPDFIIANGENSAHGKGITPKIYRELLSFGIDVVTMGNHTYAKSDVRQIISEPQLLVPINLNPKNGGKGLRYFSVKGERIGVLNVLGSAFMDRDVDDPYQYCEGLFENKAIYIVDFHGETTSEKAIFAYHFKDRMTALIGTHTHVQTADERLIDGCAFISDVGMCGAYDSIIGRDIDEVLRQTIKKEATHYTVAEGPAVFSAVVVDISDERATHIEKIQIRP